MRKRHQKVKKKPKFQHQNEHRVRRHLFTSVPLLLIGLTAIGFVCVGIYKEHNRTQKIDAESARQQEIASQINKENALLKLSVDYFATEEAQKFGAQEIGYQDADQEVAQVRNLNKLEQSLGDGELGSPGSSMSASAQDDTEEADVPHWRKWWNVFF